jgi:hypothetical protein
MTLFTLASVVVGGALGFGYYRLPAPHPTVATNPDRMILSSWVSNVAPWTRAVATRIRSAGSR